MKIVVAGGTGFLGSHLVAHLLASRHDVSVLTREANRPGEVSWTPDGTVGPWSTALTGADAVVNLAGETIAGGRWTAGRKERIRATRLQATRSLVAAMQAMTAPPATFLSASAVGYYGAHGDEPLTEETPPGDDFLASVCRDWEEAARERPPTTRLVLARTGIVLDRQGGALPQMAAPFRLGAGGPVGSGRQYMSWIHREDWVAAVAWALETETVSGPMNLTAPVPVTNREFASALGRAMKRPALLPAPAFALRILLGEMADALLLTGQRVLPTRATSLGYEFRYASLDAALHALYG